MANPRNILAGVGAGGSAGLSLAFFAPAGTTGPAGVAGTDGVQTVAVTGTPTGGTISLTWNGQTTAPIVYNAAASVVQAALNALPGGTLITATGGPLPTGVAITFPKIINQSLLVATAALSGGTTPAVTVTNTTPGTQTTNEATASIPGLFKDSGLCDTKGLAVKTNVSSSDVKAFGSLQVQRTLMTDQKKTIDLTFLETNPVAVAVYNGLPLGSVTPDASGFFKVSTGLPQTTQYGAIFHSTDGSSIMRYYAPYAQNITPGDLTLGEGTPLTRPIQLTLYPDANGQTLYEYYLVDALKV